MKKPICLLLSALMLAGAFVFSAGAVDSASAGVGEKSIETTTAPETQPAESKHVHNWGEWTVTKKATLYANGEETRTCLDDPSHTEIRVIAKIAEINQPNYNYTYTGKVIAPIFTAADVNGTLLVQGIDYTVDYVKSVNTGPYTAIVNYIGKYDDIDNVSYIISGAKQPMTVKAKSKTVKAKKAKKARQKVKNAISVSKAQGKVTYKKVKKGSSKYLAVSKKGVITVAKHKYKKGSVLKIKVKVSASGTINYNSASKTVTVKIKIK